MPANNVAWPQALQALLVGHLQCVDHVDEPTYPPLGESKRSCFAVLHEMLLAMSQQIASQDKDTGFERHACQEMAFAFFIQLLEDSCHKSFLRPRERERLKAFFAKRHPQYSKKRKESQSESLSTSVKDSAAFLAECGGEKPLMFAHQLPADYLLRFFVALPQLVDTFVNFCGGNIMDRKLLTELWVCVDFVLTELDRRSATLLYNPQTEYIP